MIAHTQQNILAPYGMGQGISILTAERIEIPGFYVGQNGILLRVAQPAWFKLSALPPT
jgi:hypothetical protein